MDFMREELRFLSTIPWEWILKLVVAACCGALIGVERELKRKAAGIRTNAMICLGAALYMLTADLIFTHYPNVNGDPMRIAGQVVVGMGFIGAGTIIQSRGYVIGLTSAAAMWVVAAIGVVIGIGFPIFGIVVTLFVLGLLVLVGRAEVLALGKCNNVHTRLSFKDKEETWEAVDHVCRIYAKDRQKFHVTRTAIQKNPICFLDVAYCDIHPSHRDFLLDLLKIEDVRRAGVRGEA